MASGLRIDLKCWKEAIQHTLKPQQQSLASLGLVTIPFQEVNESKTGREQRGMMSVLALHGSARSICQFVSTLQPRSSHVFYLHPARLLRSSAILPVDFRPFVDGRNWIVRQPLVYTIGVSKDSITIPSGFVTDFASIPQIFHSLLRQNGSYLLPAVVHDYLYWKQTCTRDQSDQILRLGMIENQVPELQRVAIYGAVRFAGGFAWEANARDQAARLLRIIPPDRLIYRAK